MNEEKKKEQIANEEIIGIIEAILKSWLDFLKRERKQPVAFYLPKESYDYCARFPGTVVGKKRDFGFSKGTGSPMFYLFIIRENKKTSKTYCV